MKWDPNRYRAHCGHVTERGKVLVELLRGRGLTRVLDLGCGDGALSGEISAFVREVIGIDRSPEMVERAAAQHRNILFRVGDARDLPWEGYFDGVFANAVFHFILEQDILLESVRRALRPGGVLVCEFGAAGNIADLLAGIEQACLDRGREYKLRFYYPSSPEYRARLEAHGFTVETLEEYDLDSPLPEGPEGLRGWVRQVFQVELGWFEPQEQEELLAELEQRLRAKQWDGQRWHMPNRRLRVVAKRD